MNVIEHKPNMSLLSPILATKLHIPHSLTDTLPRPRLLCILEEGLLRKLTFISAPSGYGKSTLVADWVQQRKHHTGWVTLDQSDNDLIRFWQYVIASVNSIFPGFEEKVLSCLNLLQSSNFQSGINLLLNELHLLGQPLVIVLDDFHFISGKILSTSFAYFIKHLPNHVHLYVISREKPPFPTARLQSQQQMRLLDTKELRFNEHEGSDFYLQCMKLDLGTDAISELVRRTEGWVTGMKLTALSIRHSNQTPPFIRGYEGDFRLLEQYLMEEVFYNQNEDIQKFLMESSILKRMNADLCNVVTDRDNSQEILEFLGQSQLFLIPLDEQKGWFRFHHLFSEFLQNTLKSSKADEVPPLLLKAGKWCETQNLPEEALEYFLEGKHYPSALALLEKITTKMVKMNWASFKLCLSKIPQHFLIERPNLYFSYVLTLIFGDWHYTLAEKMLKEAEVLFEVVAKEWSEDEKNDYLGSLYFVKAFYASEVLVDMELVVQNMKLSRQYKPTGTKLVFAQMHALGKPSLRKEHDAVPRGQLSRAIMVPFLQDLIDTVDELGLAASAKVSLAEHLYEWNEVDQAESTVRAVIESTDFNNPLASEALVPAWLLFSRIKKTQGLSDEAEKILLLAKKNSIHLGIPNALIYIDAELALLAMNKGNIIPAEEWVNVYRLSLHSEGSVNQLSEYKFLLRILMAKGEDKEAISLSEKLRTTALMNKRFYHWVDISILQALLLQKIGETERALQLLQQLLFRTEPEEFIRTYVDEGEPMFQLLSLLIQSWSVLQTKESPSLSYVRSLIACYNYLVDIAPELSSAPQPLNLILTKQEKTVLALIIDGLSNKEIATKLSVGLGTVKTHINHIYSKLQVNNRMKAIQRAKELGF
jgi:LuxR family maltose regulon positive regulatory protein